MTKEAKMLAVVEAMRRAIAEWDSDGEMDVSPMREALAALDAHTEADAERVTLAVWRDDRGAVVLAIPGGENDLPCKDWTRLGTTQITITRERGR